MSPDSVLARIDCRLVERQLKSIWADILDVPSAAIAYESDFFALGGNSMLVLSLQVAIQGQFHVEPTALQLVESPTFADLLAWIAAQPGCSHRTG